METKGSLYFAQVLFSLICDLQGQESFAGIMQSLAVADGNFNNLTCQLFPMKGCLLAYFWR
jgi:hypothetical protein